MSLSTHLKQAFSKENLIRSWNWINSSNGYAYKNYFRNNYKAYGLSVEENLMDLKKRLDNEVYQPSHSIKIYNPKKSGILRPITLLSIEDQIVYQALINIIAKRFYPYTTQDKKNISFSHRYTNENSSFFYRRWSKGYKEYNERIVNAFNEGRNITASFDLAAFYDSIDHKVLKYLLSKIKLDKEFADMLCVCLETWSSTDQKKIYHGHGIPQGPLSSGLLSELLLNCFDESTQYAPFGSDITYCRYVDDIKIMSNDEYKLRKGLVKLDFVSKNIGVFPQSNKIDIHKIEDIFKEIKTISLVPMEILFGKEKITTNKEIEEMFVNSIKGTNVLNETIFKYTLKYLKPNERLNKKLLKILKINPHLNIEILRYISRTEKISKSTSELLFSNMTALDTYEEVTARYLSTALGRAHPETELSFITICESYYKNFIYIQSVELKAIVLAWLLNNRYFKFKQIRDIIGKAEPRVNQTLIEFMDIDLYGEPSFEYLINIILKSKDTDTAMKAAYICISNNIKVNISTKEIHYLAQIPLKKLGKIGKKTSRPSSITESMELISLPGSYQTDWKKFFKKNHNKAEQQIFTCRSYTQNDATAFINQIDVFHDLLLNSLFLHDTSIGKYDLGRIGAVLYDSKKFPAKYPHLHKACKHVHDLRYKSRLSHPMIGKSKKVTTSIKFAEIKKLRPILSDGYLELISLL